MSKCDYHPDREAVTKCERCNRLICLEDKRVYHVTRSSGTGNFRNSWSERYELCPLCESDTRINSARASRTLILIGVFFIGIIGIGGFFIFRSVFGTIQSTSNNIPNGFSPFNTIFYVSMVIIGLIFFAIIFVLVRSFTTAPSRIEQAKRDQAQFLNSLNSLPKGISSNYNKQPNINWKMKTSLVEVNCNQCGSLVNLNDRFCKSCGSSTKDERAQYGFNS